MPRRIEEDHKEFRDIFSGKIRKALRKYINNGQIFRTRGDGKKVKITIPNIDIPFITFGDNGEGVSRGGGKPGDVFKRDPQKGKGNKAGEEGSEGIVIQLDMEDVIQFMQDELGLPDLLPKPNETFEDVKIVYNDISLTGPESLRHNRRTMLQALKRMCASGEINDLKSVPGFANPVKLITPINDDKRYRQYKEIKIPSSNAVIFFARDGSASMDDAKCQVVSDMCWWIDVWIKSFYENVQKCYVWHDVTAEEVDEKKFYRYRYGGGTKCSSVVDYISKQFESRYLPERWNIYVFYFSDGENWGTDNEVFYNLIKEKMPPDVVNFMGITQVFSYGGDDLKSYIDNQPLLANLKTTEITGNSYTVSGDEVQADVNEQIRRAIVDLLGKQNVK